MPSLEIVQQLKEHYGEGVFSQLLVYYWSRQVKLGRTDLANTVSPGRASDENLATVIANKFESDPHLSARKPAYLIGIVVSTVS
jgi:hypothetical protein